MDKGLAAARILNRKGNLLEYFSATDIPKMPPGSFWSISARGIHSPSCRTREEALGCDPIQSSAWGFVAGEGRPRSWGMKVFDPQAYSWIGFFKTQIFSIEFHYPGPTFLLPPKGARKALIEGISRALYHIFSLKRSKSLSSDSRNAIPLYTGNCCNIKLNIL
jgi:hypothetical protein